MATIAEHMAARNDNDLLQRLVAAAERAGIPSPQAWAEANRGAIVATQIGETTLADVHAYAVASYEPTPRPGADASKITDPQVEAAVAAVSTREEGAPEQG